MYNAGKSVLVVMKSCIMGVGLDHVHMVDRLRWLSIVSFWYQVTPSDLKGGAWIVGGHKGGRSQEAYTYTGVDQYGER